MACNMSNQRDSCVVAVTWLDVNGSCQSKLVRPLMNANLISAAYTFPPTECVNSLSSLCHLHEGFRSTFMWKGEFIEGKERQLLLKTTRDRVSSIEAQFRSIFEFEVPEVLALDENLVKLEVKKPKRNEL